MTKSILLICGHKNIENKTAKGLRKWRAWSELKKSTGASGERDWVWEKLMPLLKDKLIASGIQVFITDAIYHEETYNRDYDLAMALHYDAGNENSRCIIAKPRLTIDPPFIVATASAKSDEFISSWLAIYPKITGITSNQKAITEGMTDYYVWDYVGTESPSVIIEHGNNTCPADHDKLFNQTEVIAEADCQAVRKFFGITEEVDEELPVGAEDLELHKKVDELAEKVVQLTTNLNLLTEKAEKLTDQIDNVKKDTEEIYKDRDEIVVIKEKLTTLDGKVEMSLAKQTSIETELKTDLRALGDLTDGKLAELAKRIKVLEDRPIPTDDKIKIIQKFGPYFIGKIIK